MNSTSGQHCSELCDDCGLWVFLTWVSFRQESWQLGLFLVCLVTIIDFSIWDHYMLYVTWAAKVTCWYQSGILSWISCFFSVLQPAVTGLQAPSAALMPATLHSHPAVPGNVQSFQVLKSTLWRPLVPLVAALATAICYSLLGARTPQL